MGTQETSPAGGFNQAVVVGQLVAEPTSRMLPSGVVALEFSLTVRSPGIKTTSVPIVWYDPPKRSAKWTIGDVVAVAGAVVRRFYRGGSGRGSSTEVVVERAELARHRSKASALLQVAMRPVADAVADLADGDS